MLLCACFFGFAQEPIEEEMPRRQMYVRFGCDLSRFALPYIGDIGSHGLEFSVDGEVKYDWFPVIEFGKQWIKHNPDSLNYKMNGSYGRVGFDYNVLKYQHRLDRDMFFIGLRMAHSRFSHELPSVVMNNYGEELRESIAKRNLSATWGEMTVGAKAEILNNLYLGITVRLKVMLAHTNYENVTPYIVPGFGKGFYKINGGISYSIMYAIPFRGVGSDGFEEVVEEE